MFCLKLFLKNNVCVCVLLFRDGVFCNTDRVFVMFSVRHDCGQQHWCASPLMIDSSTPPLTLASSCGESHQRSRAPEEKRAQPEDARDFLKNSMLVSFLSFHLSKYQKTHVRSKQRLQRASQVSCGSARWTVHKHRRSEQRWGNTSTNTASSAASKCTRRWAEARTVKSSERWRDAVERRWATSAAFISGLALHCVVLNQEKMLRLI